MNDFAFLMTIVLPTGSVLAECPALIAVIEGVEARRTLIAARMSSLVVVVDGATCALGAHASCSCPSPLFSDFFTPPRRFFPAFVEEWKNSSSLTSIQYSNASTRHHSIVSTAQYSISTPLPALLTHWYDAQWRTVLLPASPQMPH